MKPSTDELRDLLEQMLSDHFGTRRTIRKLQRRRSVYSSSYSIENLEVKLDHGQQLRVVWKDLSPVALLPAAQQVRPQFLYSPGREIHLYQNVLDARRFGTPICYGAVDSPKHGRHWLFLERVTGPLLWQIGRMEAWEQAARWLARFHTRVKPSPKLLRYDEEFFGLWPARAKKFQRHTDAATARRFARLTARYDRVIERLMELPTALVHGEFYPSNVILRKTTRGRQVCPIDWEVAAIAPALIDLAALTSGEWPEDKRRQMVSAYRDALDQKPSLAELMEGVEYCQLHLAVQLLGWSANWSPPEQHAKNWLREAFRLAEKLGIL